MNKLQAHIDAGIHEYQLPLITALDPAFKRVPTLGSPSKVDASLPLMGLDEELFTAALSKEVFDGWDCSEAVPQYDLYDEANLYEPLMLEGRICQMEPPRWYEASKKLNTKFTWAGFTILDTPGGEKYEIPAVPMIQKKNHLVNLLWREKGNSIAWKFWGFSFVLVGRPVFFVLDAQLARDITVQPLALKTTVVARVIQEKFSEQKVVSTKIKAYVDYKFKTSVKDRMFNEAVNSVGVPVGSEGRYTVYQIRKLGNDLQTCPEDFQ